MSRAVQRDLVIPPVASVTRRRRCLADTRLFLTTYFAGIFYQPFTADRLDMIEAIEHAAKYGGDQAIAGPRGDGKTRSALFVTLKLMLTNELRFPLIVSKSGPRANRELRNLKEAIRASDGLLADFPEVMVPIVALGGWASRARQQTAYGEFTRMEWGEECVILPTIPTAALAAKRSNRWNRHVDSAATGQVVASLGIEGPIRGYTVRNDRPGLALLDDIDDRESARSELQTVNRQAIIEQDIGGLAGPDKTIARVMLCTLINDSCIASIYTDRKRKPSWRGQRHRLLSTLPERGDLWDEYIAMREGRGEDDPDARRAHEFYSARRKQMDAGAIVTNPYRFDSRPLADGTPGQLSAIQACYDIIADRGWEHFNTEYQNEPPAKEAAIDSGISAEKIQSRLSGFDRYETPPSCTIQVQGIDVRKIGLHYVVKAFEPNATSYVVDYGFHETYGTTYGSDEGVELAVRRAILDRLEQTQQQSPGVTLTLVDSGWMTPAVYQACLDIGHGIYPAKGSGKSHGCAAMSFSPARAETNICKPGDGWRMDYQPIRRGVGVWLVNCDADRWKSFEHARWLTPEGKAGAAYLFGHVTDEERRWLDRRLPQDARDHFAFAKHLTSEVETEDVIRGTLRRFWRTKPGRVQNHYLDASYLCNVAAAMLGAKIMQSAQYTEQTKRPALVAAANNRPARW